MFNNYYWFWEAAIPKEKCKQFIADHFDEKQATTATIGGKNGEQVIDKAYRETELSWAFPGTELFDTMFDYIKSANQNAGWNLDITGMEDVQVGRYGINGHYDWHEDIFAPCPENFQRKLSCSIQLSDPDTHEGGDLVIRTSPKGDETITAPRAQGSVIIFPSFMVHKVTPVTSGERYSAVGWMRGPAFR
jgi:PKHD-type hydroxylase